MSLLAIPGIINSAISALTHHGSKKGVQGAAALDSTGGPDSTSGSQAMFGSVMDAAEKLLGVQVHANTSAAGSATGTSAANGGKLSPLAMITAARSALQKT